MVEELLQAGLQVVVVDPVGVWWGLRASADGQHEGLPIVIMDGEHGDGPLEVGAGEIIADVVVDEGLSVVLDLSYLRKGEQTSLGLKAWSVQEYTESTVGFALHRAWTEFRQRPDTFAGYELQVLSALADTVASA